MNTLDVQNKLYDKKFRASLRHDVSSVVHELGYSQQDGVEYVVKTNTADTFYLALPAEGSDVADNLENIQAAGAGTAGSAGTIGTALCLCTCLSSAASASTVGTNGG